MVKSKFFGNSCAILSSLVSMNNCFSEVLGNFLCLGHDTLPHTCVVKFRLWRWIPKILFFKERQDLSHLHYPTGWNTILITLSNQLIILEVYILLPCAKYVALDQFFLNKWASIMFLTHLFNWIFYLVSGFVRTDHILDHSYADTWKLKRIHKISSTTAYHRSG